MVVLMIVYFQREEGMLCAMSDPADPRCGGPLVVSAEPIVVGVGTSVIGPDSWLAPHCGVCDPSDLGRHGVWCGGAAARGS